MIFSLCFSFFLSFASVWMFSTNLSSDYCSINQVLNPSVSALHIVYCPILEFSFGSFYIFQISGDILYLYICFHTFSLIFLNIINLSYFKILGY